MTDRRTFMAAAAAALAGLALLGGAEPARAQGRTEREAFTWEGRIPQGRWIMVRNMNGAIDVQPSTGDRVEVIASRHTRRGDPEYVRFEVQKVGPNGSDILICALWGEDMVCDERGSRSRNNDRDRDRDRRRNEITVDFTVRVPRGVKTGVHSLNGEVRVDGVDAEVDASSVNGGVFVRSSSGPVNANTVNGSVRAVMGKFDLDTDLRFSSVNGTVVAEFAEEINADVELSTVNGRFLTDFPVTISGRIDPRRLRAQIGKGGPRVRLNTVNGNVELRKR